MHFKDYEKRLEAYSQALKETRIPLHKEKLIQNINDNIIQSINIIDGLKSSLSELSNRHVNNQLHWGKIQKKIDELKTFQKGRENQIDMIMSRRNHTKMCHLHKNKIKQILRFMNHKKQNLNEANNKKLKNMQYVLAKRKTKLSTKQRSFSSFNFKSFLALRSVWDNFLISDITNASLSCPSQSQVN